MLRAVSATLYGRRGFYVALLLLPPLLWLGIVYLGSLFALLMQSFYAIDEFTARIVPEFTLATYGQLLSHPANVDIILRTLAMAIAVTLAAAVIAFPVANYMARYASGRMKAFFGNYGMFIRAYTYIRMMGPDGLRAVSENAVLNANYLKALVSPHYKLAVERTCMHEFVVHGDIAGTDVIALDVSKRLIDYGHHPPTNYFPLIVHDALMIEPTETESKKTLDDFADVLVKIKGEAQQEPELLHDAPHITPVYRLDEATAARNPRLCYKG